jgi:hypothetical protein
MHTRFLSPKIYGEESKHGCMCCVQDVRHGCLGLHRRCLGFTQENNLTVNCQFGVKKMVWHGLPIVLCCLVFATSVLVLEKKPSRESDVFYLIDDESTLYCWACPMWHFF